MRRLNARRNDEDGVALLLALAFLSLFGLWISSLLTLATADAKSTIQLRQVAADEYEADGAIEQAINYVRPNLEMGRSGQRIWQCGSVTDLNTTAVSTATCAAGSGGVASGGTDNPNNHPARAILALGTNTSEKGIDHNSTGALSVHGGIFSSTNITNNSSPAMNVEGDVTAQGACTGTIISTMPPAHCSDSTTVADPGYLSSISAPAILIPPAACPVSPAWLIDVLPGTYTDATLLNSISSCSNAVLWFEPGTYYFDFQNAGTHVWTVNLPSTSNLVAGTERGWVHTNPSKPSISFPGGCKTGFDSSPNMGALFVFGGDSQLSVTGGKAEICATPSSSGQEIAVYGLTTSSSATTTTLTPSTATQTAGTWTNPNNATGALDSATADISQSIATESMTLSAYSTIPAGATISAVTLRFAHRDELHVSSVSVTLTPGDGSGSCTAVAGTVSTSLHTDSANVTTCLSTLAKVNGVTARFDSVRTNGSQAQHLDGVVLDVTYTGTPSHAESGCVTTQPYPSSGCALLKTSGSTTQLAVQGTVYAPLAALDVTLTGVNYAVFSRGIISRIFKSAIVAAGGYTGDEIAVPDDCPYGVSVQNPVACTTGTRTDRTLTITTSIAGVTKATVAVTFVDGSSAPITPGGTVTINGWSVNR